MHEQNMKFNIEIYDKNKQILKLKYTITEKSKMKWKASKTIFIMQKKKTVT